MGHFKKKCLSKKKKPETSEVAAEENMVQSVCMGEIAGLMHIVATVNSQVKKLHKVKVPHTVYED